MQLETYSVVKPDKIEDSEDCVIIAGHGYLVGWEHPNYANTSIVEREGGQDAPTTVTGRAGCPPHKKMIFL